MYNEGEIRVVGDRIELYYHDPRGRPRHALLMYCLGKDLVWIKPRTSILIGALETNDDGSRFLKIPID